MLSRRASHIGTLAVEVGPTAVAALLACLLAWRERGSVAAPDWLGYALVLLLLLAAVTLAGAPRRPGRAGLVGIAALAALALWAAASAAWAPLPSLARDEALLTALYAAALAVPLLTLRTAAGRIAALGVLVAALGATSFATALHVGWGDDPISAYAGSGRLYFPITYVNAQAAFALGAFWPAIALAGRRAGAPWARALALAAATAMVGVGTLTQSRGAAVALAASAVVVLVLLPTRLRLALTAAVPLALAAIAFGPLTAPFAAQSEGRAALADAIPPAGRAIVWITVASLVVGFVLAFIDRRVSIAPRQRVLVGRGGAALVALLLTAGVVAASNRVDEPREQLRERWAEFKHEPTTETAGTHFLSPGSNRYDFWRVALAEFRDHPVAGGGARSFGPVYLQERESPETPARTHSLPLELLAELGLVGGLLFLVGIGVPLAALVRRRAQVPAAAALAGAAFWLTQAAVDWTWTFPACGIPFFLLLGIGLAEDGPRLARQTRLAAGVLAVTVALFAFAPPWLSARYVAAAATSAPRDAGAALDRARALDPFSTDSYYLEAAQSPTAGGRVAALRGAVRREPESVRAQYLLGLALLDAGRKAEARTALREARRLFPGEPLIGEALRRAR